MDLNAKLKTLVYSKGFDNELTHKLLHILDSKTILEDLIELVGEYYDRLNESYSDCDMNCEEVHFLGQTLKKLKCKLKKLKEERDNVRTKIREVIYEVTNSHCQEIALKDLSYVVDNYVRHDLGTQLLFGVDKVFKSLEEKENK